VIALLHVKGLTVIAVQNSLSALADDVDAVTRVINRQPSPVVLVGHGYGETDYAGRKSPECCRARLTALDHGVQRRKDLLVGQIARCAEEHEGG
jgi:pimeloyl-ACP methyl ester carboxylesterase